MVLLVFDPRQTWARLYDYDPADRRVGIALCAEHGDGVSVPAGWTIVDDRSPASHLAAVRAADPTPDEIDPLAADQEVPEPEAPEPVAAPAPVGAGEGRAARTSGDGRRRASSPTLWSVEDPSPAPDEPEPTGDAEVAPEPVDAATERDPLDRSDDLDVDDSTPLLSRAFRAAHVD